MSNRTKQGKCTSGKFKRVNYFHGMLLTEQDFQDEQAYLREKLKLHNRLHGYGVVWGLELKIKCIEVEGDPVSKVFLTPGLAIDCAGNEIVVCQEQLVPLDEKIEAMFRSCKLVFPPPKLCVALRYCECATNPETQYTASCANEERQPNFARVREGFGLELFKADELPKCCREHKQPNEQPQKGCCQSYRQDCPDLAACCEEEHIIVIGCLQQYISQSTDPANLAKHKYTEDMIDPCFEPCRVYQSHPYDDWERRKHALIRQACFESKWIDFSGVVGREINEATTYLKKIDLVFSKDDDSIPISKLDPQELIARIANAISCAKRGSRIKLITDSEQRCVLFAFWEEEGNDE